MASSKLERLQGSVERARRNKEETTQRYLGIAVSHVGGIVAAAIKRYVPMVVPGDSFDHPVVGAIAIALDAWGVLASDRWPSYLAAANNGYLTGTAVEKILP